jgi:hypothetical protein
MLFVKKVRDSSSFPLPFVLLLDCLADYSRRSRLSSLADCCNNNDMLV